MTIELKETPLRDVVKWLQEERHINAVIDGYAVGEGYFALDEPINDHLDEEPIYFLLDRLESLEIDWYIKNEIVHMTTPSRADTILFSVVYDLGELEKQKYKPQELIKMLMETSSGLWESDGDGEGSVNLLGNTLIVLQTYNVNREIGELLAALQDPPSKWRYIAEPPQHEVLRNKLEQTIDVNFQKLPFADVIAQLSARVQIDLRINPIAVDDYGIDLSEPITLSLKNVKVWNALATLLAPLELTHIVHNGAVQIVPLVIAESILNIVVYDVRDIVRNEIDRRNLTALIVDQSGLWEHLGDGEGTLSFPKPGIMVIRQTED
ncbi:MAG: hypothetical protein ACKVT0_14290, partial [Planctomycetaceae bacterium]